MRKVKYFPKTVGEPEKNGFFISVVSGTIICIPFWIVVLYFIFN